MSSFPSTRRRSQRISKPSQKKRDIEAIEVSATLRDRNLPPLHSSARKARAPATTKDANGTTKSSKSSKERGASKKKTSRSTGAGLKKGRQSARQIIPAPFLFPGLLGHSSREGSAESIRNQSGMAAEPKTRGRPKSTAASAVNGKVKGGTKRKTEDENENGEHAAVKPAAKKARATKPAKVKEKVVINHAPTERLDVFVCGEGANGELGLGTAKNVIDVKRPRLNQLLSAAESGVVQLACGGMHALALKHDGTVLSWGINDGGALGRPTGKGPLQDLDNEDVDMDDASDSGLNPDEATPATVVFPEDVVIVQVAAGDGVSLALTDDGHVYGWGEFRGLQGEFGFWRDMDAGHKIYEEDVIDENGEKAGTKLRYELAGIIRRQMTPRLYTELSNITDIACGNNHCLARDRKGMIFTWGIGEQHQLGRRQIERIDTDLKRSLVPQPLRTGKTSFKSIFCAADHSFAIDSKNQVHGWGFNGYGQLAMKGTEYFKDSNEWKEVPAEVVGPIVIKALTDASNPVVKLAGGQKHSMALRQDGTLLTWGLIEFSGVNVSNIPPSSLLYNQEPGRGNIPSAVIDPVPVPGLGTVVYPGCGSEHILAINSAGKAFSWGSGSVYQLGLGADVDQPVPTMVDNTAVRDKHLNWASGGGQYSMFTAPASVTQK